MQKTVTVILALLVLVLAAVNARLRDSERLLEDRLAAAEKKTHVKPRPALPRTLEIPNAPTTPSDTSGALSPAAPSRQESSVTHSAPARAQAEFNPVRHAVAADSGSSLDLNESLTNVVQQELEEVTYTLQPATQVSIQLRGALGLHEGDDLELSETHKMFINGVKNTRDMETQLYKDKIKEIEDRTEAHIRQTLDPEQLKKYDATNAGIQIRKQLLRIWRPRRNDGSQIDH